MLTSVHSFWTKMVICGVATLLLLIAACGGSPPGVETAHQSYWYCWNREVLLPDVAHPQTSDPTLRGYEHLCTNPELKDKKCTPIPSPAPNVLRTEVIVSGWNCPTPRASVVDRNPIEAEIYVPPPPPPVEPPVSPAVAVVMASKPVAVATPSVRRNWVSGPGVDVSIVGVVGAPCSGVRPSVGSSGAYWDGCANGAWLMAHPTFFGAMNGWGIGTEVTVWSADGSAHTYHVISNSVYPAGSTVSISGAMIFQVCTTNVAVGSPVRVLGAN